MLFHLLANVLCSCPPLAAIICKIYIIYIQTKQHSLHVFSFFEVFFHRLVASSSSCLLSSLISSSHTTTLLVQAKFISVLSVYGERAIAGRYYYIVVVGGTTNYSLVVTLSTSIQLKYTFFHYFNLGLCAMCKQSFRRV
jgi:hypothetical protein